MVEAQVYAGFDPDPDQKRATRSPATSLYKVSSTNRFTHRFFIDLARLPPSPGARASCREYSTSRSTPTWSSSTPGKVIEEEGAWAFAGDQRHRVRRSPSGAGGCTYECGHPAKGHFIDSPVKGLTLLDLGRRGRHRRSGALPVLAGRRGRVLGRQRLPGFDALGQQGVAARHLRRRQRRPPGRQHGAAAAERSTPEAT